MSARTQLSLLLVAGLALASWDFLARVYVPRDSAARELAWSQAEPQIPRVGLESALAVVDRWLPAADGLGDVDPAPGDDTLHSAVMERPDQGTIGDIGLRLLAVFGGPDPFVVVSIRTRGSDRPELLRLASGEAHGDLAVTDIAFQSAVFTLREDRLALALFRPTSERLVTRE